LIAGGINVNTLNERVKDSSGGSMFPPFEGAGDVNLLSVMKDGLGWGDDVGEQPEFSGSCETFTNEHEHLHGLAAPKDAYPLLESRLRYLRGHSVDEHQTATALMNTKIVSVN